MIGKLSDVPALQELRCNLQTSPSLSRVCSSPVIVKLTGSSAVTHLETRHLQRSLPGVQLHTQLPTAAAVCELKWQL